MKNYLTEWKKWKSVLKENVNAAQDSLERAKEKEKKIVDYAEMLKKQAAEEVSQAQGAIEQAIEQAKAEEQQSSLTSSRIGASPLKTENAAGERDEGEMGQQPGGHQDVANAYGPDELATEQELTEEELEEACGVHKGIEEGGKECNLELKYEEVEEKSACNECRTCALGSLLTEAKYKGRKVALGKPMRGDVKKFKVFVRDPSTGNIKKVNFGDKKMRIKKSDPKRRKSFRARHRCANPGPRTKARYWSCRKW